jgi:hypothetical protein
LSHTSSPFCSAFFCLFCFFWDWVSRYLPWWPWTLILLILASKVARITVWATSAWFIGLFFWQTLIAQHSNEKNWGWCHRRWPGSLQPGMDVLGLSCEVLMWPPLSLGPETQQKLQLIHDLLIRF